MEKTLGDGVDRDELAIDKRIEEYGQKLLKSDISKRARKRALQALGKLKKQKDEKRLRRQRGLEEGGNDDEEREGPDEELEAVEREERHELHHRSLMNNKQKKTKMRIINKEISEFAKGKQLKAAKKRFEYALKNGLTPDVHTFTNLMNVYVRCHRPKEAGELLDAMRAAHLEPNIITFTTLLRGFAESGDMRGMMNILHEITETEVEVNVRSLNTLLRGCVRVGETHAPWRVFQYIRDKRNKKDGDDDHDKDDHFRVLKLFEDVQPNASSYELIVKSLAQALRISEALEVLEYMLGEQRGAQSVSAGGRGVDSSSNPVSAVCIS